MLDAGLAGTRLWLPFREVDPRLTMNYAAAVGDANPRYLDDRLPDGIVAPPLYAVAFGWPAVEALRKQLWERVDPEAAIRMVHAGERLEFLRPLRPGDRIGLEAEVESVAASRAGALLALRIEARDTKGAIRFIERSTALFRGVGVEGERLSAGGPEADPPVAAELDRNCPIATHPLDAHRYDGLSGIAFAIHTSPAFAEAAGLPGIVLQGTAVLALAARELVDRECGGDPGRLRSIGCRFAGLTSPGQRLNLRWTTPGPEGEVAFAIEDSDGRPVLSRGRAGIRQQG